MDKTEINQEKKEAITAEYLLKKISYRALGKKHDIDLRLIHKWVLNFQGKPKKSMKIKSEEIVLFSEVTQAI